jgi:uncharacterized protein (TIGR03083 family)
VDHGRYCDELDQEIERFAARLSPSAMGRAVPSCPGWNVADLSSHVGSVHRWAEHLVRTDAQRYEPFTEVAPEEVDAPWILAGGTALVTTLRAADPSHPMWAWGRDQRVGFWSRRQLHETLVHRIDLQLALGEDPVADVPIAADGIDEFLVNLAPAAVFSPKVTNLKGTGERIVVRAADDPGAWTITLDAGGFTIESGAAGTPVATMSGAALELLLVLYRRQSLESAAVSVHGSRERLEFWLANSALE